MAHDASPGDDGPDHDRSRLSGLACHLVDDGLLDLETARQLEQQARQAGRSLLSHVVDVAAVTPRQAVEAAGRAYDLPVTDLNDTDVMTLPALDDHSVELLRRLEALPLYRDDKRLGVAIGHPGLLAELDELRFATGLAIEGVLASGDQLRTCLHRYLAARRDTPSAMARIASSPAEYATEDASDAADATETDGPLVAFVDSILQDAIKQGASDIHFEPYADQLRIRLRIDGRLHDQAHPPCALRARLAARLKVMARLDISERRLPQDGAIKWRPRHGDAVDFRVNTLPTVHGEKVVLRLLDPATALWDLDQLGLNAAQQALYAQALDNPQGMILVTGPTGSGKTVTLYTGLRQLNEISRNICTAEDPVEIKLEGINQVNVLPRIGLDFASTLRAFLRQDPDVVMVGEIRDRETAEIAVKAAQTGHLVLSTLHTNSAAQTLARLADMGIAPFNVASSVSLIIAQRLARRLCDHCKRAVRPDAASLEAMGPDIDPQQAPTLHEPVGCHECIQGFRGRIGLYEVVPIDAAMRERILRRGKASDLEQQARDSGYPSLRQNGIDKVLQGLTSLAEVHRVTGHN
ncbi:type IV-A pilus assembly ATPase PilB [Halomonas sabkhae]|uniref:type IV-A pilus assembly ATPase PilB n=1 Tax=Halomonas sabkhae TaxID=626223 RepID=UPI0025B45B79|nr:type IV-A pilus assembly ATPase PilB [Halomonas sabkhae]MDN3523870.1 type IV-A pilus assembly ATPase PilB [Halomonas sabkhae]